MSQKRTNEADEDLLQRLVWTCLERWQWKYRELRNPNNLAERRWVNRQRSITSNAPELSGTSEELIDP